jgi:signal transduction histidine kinase
MSLNAELLAEDLADSPHHELVETITREIRRLDQLTGRYLEMSRGRRSELNPVDPLELVKDVLLAEGQALQQAGVETVLQGVSPGVVEVDTDALRRALLNILRNASEAGATRVELALRTLQGEKSSTDRLVLQIQDNGPGIEPTQVKRVFEPFFTTKAGGTGLGLAISRQELEDVGGSLVANSEPDQGSRFVLEIPFRQG